MNALTSVLKEELSLDIAPQHQELRQLLKSLRTDDKTLTDSSTAMKERYLCI